MLKDFNKIASQGSITRIMDEKIARYFNKLEYIIKNPITLASILHNPKAEIELLFSPNKKPTVHEQLVFY